VSVVPGEADGYKVSVQDLESVAERAVYVGSGEHKRFPNPLADPRLRSDASDCDAVDPSLSQDPERLTRWLREAIRRRQVSPEFEGDFPRYVWAWIPAAQRTALVEARLTNSGLGQYKGYFIDLDEDLPGRVRRQLVAGGAWSKVIS
jgi:hypothetical protein